MKPWYQSKTIRGLAFTLIMALIQMFQEFGIVVPGEFVSWMDESFITVMTSIGELTGVLYATYGRTKAKDTLTL